MAPKKYFIVAGIVILLLVTGYFFIKYQESQKLLNNPAALAEREVANIVTQVGKIIDLPSGENPQVLTVSDKSKLKGQTFFSKSQNGDKVLLYEKNRKAILFRPSTGKIIEISTIASSVQTTPSVSPTTSAGPSPTNKPKIKLAIFNGTKVSGLASTTEKKLSSSYPEVEVTQTGNANESYTKTIIVDVTGKHDDFIKRLSSFLSATKSTMPQSESKSEADILVILGM